MDLPDDFLWSSYELPVESVPPVTSKLLSPGISSPLSQVETDALVLNDFSLLDMGEMRFLPLEEMEKELFALGDMSTFQNDVSSEHMEISQAQNEDFQELFGSNIIRNKIEIENHLLEENNCTKVLHPHNIGEEIQDQAKSLSGEVVDSVEHESFYSPEVLECEICFKKCSTLFELKDHYQMCYLEMWDADETSVSNLKEEEITISFPDSGTCIIPAIFPDGFSPDVITSSKTQSTLMYQKSSMTGKGLAENVVASSIDSNKLIPELSPNINISFKPVTKKAKVKLSHKTVYECSICSMIYEHKQPLLCHIKNHTKKKWHRCPSSPQIKKKHTPGKVETYPCTLCGRIFSKKSTRTEHERIHSGKKPYKCDICLFSCSQSSNLKRHKKSHDGLLRPFTCTICSFKFSTKERLDAHSCGPLKFLTKTIATKISVNLQETVEKSISQTKEKPTLKCSICLKNFQYKSFLRNHFRTHFNERPFQCSFCPKNYKLAGELKIHVTNHGKDMPYRCTCCVKGFYNSSDLQSHINMYHKQFQFLCMYCGKGFYKKALLLSHESTHMKEKPFMCEICPFSCSQASNLQRHLKSHKGSLKPFACMSCNHKFTLDEELNAHSATHARKAKTASNGTENVIDVESTSYSNFSA